MTDFAEHVGIVTKRRNDCDRVWVIANLVTVRVSVDPIGGSHPAYGSTLLPLFRDGMVVIVVMPSSSAGPTEVPTRFDLLGPAC
jgi:hypothetical protein